MIVFGGSGPLHGARVARKLQIPRVICPWGAGVMSAFGLLTTFALDDSVWPALDWGKLLVCAAGGAVVFGLVGLWRYGRAAAPLAFNVHFHDGNAVIEPISVASTQGESGEFSADRDQTYCLMWEAGAGGSVLEYRVERLRR